MILLFMFLALSKLIASNSLKYPLSLNTTKIISRIPILLKEFNNTLIVKVN